MKLRHRLIRRICRFFVELGGDVTVHRRLDVANEPIDLDPVHDAMIEEATDRFGDNGIIGVVAVARDSDADARIDLWLMSCRVLGRKVEEAILADVVARARAFGARRLIGEYNPTAKNALVRELYPHLGFKELSRSGASVFYALPLDDMRAGASVEFIAMAERGAPAVATAG